VCVRKRVCVTYRKEINSLFKMGVGGGVKGVAAPKLVRCTYEVVRILPKKQISSSVVVLEASHEDVNL
jgi:hypothetical protein